jgi:hypothetical protein
VLRAPLSALQDYTTLTTPPSPDLLAVGPDDSLLTGSREGKMFRISPSGEVSVLASGYQQPCGLAFDAANRRLFIADHNADTTNGPLITPDQSGRVMCLCLETQERRTPQHHGAGRTSSAPG